MKINMLRHWESTFNKMWLIQWHSQESVLTELWRQQIEKLSSVIINKVFYCVYVSDLKRTIETWDILSEYIEVDKIIVTSWLREQWQWLFEWMPYSYNDFQTLKQHELINDEVYRDLCDKYKTETIISFKERIENFFQSIPINKEILLITHGWVIWLKIKEIKTENAKIYLINN